MDRHHHAGQGEHQPGTPAAESVSRFYPSSHLVEEVYELYDETHPQKMKLSEERMRQYESKGFTMLKSEK